MPSKADPEKQAKFVKVKIKKQENIFAHLQKSGKKLKKQEKIIKQEQ